MGNYSKLKQKEGIVSYLVDLFLELSISQTFNVLNLYVDKLYFEWRGLMQDIHQWLFRELV